MDERIKEIKVAIFDGEVKESDIAWLIKEVESTKELKLEVEYCKELNTIMKDEIKKVNEELIKRTSEKDIENIRLMNENNQLKRRVRT